MIDLGLLMSVIVAAAAVWTAERRWPLATVPSGQRYLDTVMWAALAGLAIGRLAFLLIEDRSSIGSLRDMTIVRSGVEFWPGLLVAAGVAALSASRSGVGGAARLADLAPITLVGYGTYEASCLFRGGCFGPLTSVGLQPDGIGSRMFPVGIAMGAGAVAAAAAIQKMLVGGRQATAVIALSLTSLSLIKAIGSIWLPDVSEGLTRQQASSAAIAVASLLTFVALLVGGQRASQAAGAR